MVNKVDEQLNKLVKEIFITSRETYGTRRLKEVLIQRYGLVVSKRRIGKIMSFLNLKTKMKRKFKVITTTSNHNFDIAPNRINRDFYSS
ncbi:IS3 family transposase [Aliarcobacter butzleri]|uniref:IS3 family transposase n=1 Tax=Aliarcobacter butzleri TaxID=28197 RepID=UPI0039BE256A